MHGDCKFLAGIVWQNSDDAEDHSACSKYITHCSSKQESIPGGWLRMTAFSGFWPKKMQICKESARDGERGVVCILLVYREKDQAREWRQDAVRRV